MPPETLVGQEVATFALGLSATGTVITANTAPVSAIAETQLRAQVEPDHQLVAGSVRIDVGDPVVDRPDRQRPGHGHRPSRSRSSIPSA